MAVTQNSAPPEIWQKIRDLEEELQEGKHARVHRTPLQGPLRATQTQGLGEWRNRVDWGWFRTLLSAGTVSTCALMRANEVNEIHD